MISSVGPSEAGVYACELSTHAQLRHQLVVTSAPVILRAAARLGGGRDNRQWIEVESDGKAKTLGPSG